MAKTKEDIKQEAKEEFKEELREIVEELKPKKRIKDKDGTKDVKVTLRLKTVKERDKLNATAKNKGYKSTSAYLKFLIKEYPKLEKEVRQLRKKLAE